jgi:hypothetical protein
MTNEREKAVLLLLSGVAWIVIGLGTASRKEADHALHWGWLLFVIGAVGLGALTVLLGLLVIRGRPVVIRVRRPRRRL